jgi:hypothetical protein
MAASDSDDQRVTETRTSYDPVTRSTTQIRTETPPSRTGAWAIGVIAVAAIAAVVFLATRSPTPAPTNDQSVASAAAAQGVAQQAAQDAQASAATAQMGSAAAQSDARSAQADRSAAAPAAPADAGRATQDSPPPPATQSDSNPPQ